MNRKQWVILLVLNCIIAFSFFLKNIGVGYSAVSSDLHNIIPMCLKLDNPDLYQNDLFADDVANFKYYTPFFISTLRQIASWVRYDYLKALNILLLVTSVTYGITWFLLFFKTFKKHFWLAVLLSVLIRGVVWLPGSEMWGIGDLWTMMPRTLYAALLPIPFLLLFSQNPWRFLLGGLAMGFILNFHPISGLGGILIWLILLLYLLIAYKTYITLKQFALSIVTILIGMFPFILVYFTRTEIVADYNSLAYLEAFSARIASFFFEPLEFLSLWLKTRYLFFVIPLVVLLFWSYISERSHFKNSLFLVVLAWLLIIIPTLSIPVENIVNNYFDTNIRMSFQLIRIQKLAILPAYFAIGYLMYFLFQKFRHFKKAPAITVLIYLLLVITSSEKVFSNIQVIGDDITREIFPKVSDIYKPRKQRLGRYDKMANYINANIPEDAVFYNTFIFRPSTKRSVALDGKGASIIIEGNPKKLIAWNQTKKHIKELDNLTEIVKYLASLDIDYWVTKDTLPNTMLVHEIEGLKLYKLK